jgi:hypothetical protein
VRNGYREYRRIQHQQRLDGAKYVRVPREQVSGFVVAVLELWKLVFPST